MLRCVVTVWRIGAIAGRAAVVFMVAATAGCSSTGVDSRWGVRSSERVASQLGPISKGGGVYKVGKPYMIGGRWYYPREEPGYDRTGIASWYGDDFHGRRTSNGEIFNMNALTAAHPTLPLPSYAYVTNLDSGRTVLVRINDRGPYVGNRIIDLSRASAQALGYKRRGLGNVRVRYAGRAPMNGDDSRERRFVATQPWYGGGEASIVPAAPPDSVASNSFAPDTAITPAWSVNSYRAGAGATAR
jgi:rare lipoprotein A